MDAAVFMFIWFAAFLLQFLYTTGAGWFCLFTLSLQLIESVMTTGLSSIMHQSCEQGMVHIPKYHADIAQGARRNNY